MLASNKTMEALRGIGLNLYERKLWVALLSRGISTAGELSTIANVPRSRTYDVLQSLADKGFVVIQSSKPLKYVAIPPEEALERAKAKIEEELKEKMERIEELKSSPVMKELNEIFSHGLKIISPEEITGSLKGKYSLQQQLATMFRDASKQIAIVTTPEGLIELTTNHLEALKKAKENGVSIKIATSGKEKASEAIKALSGIAEIRILDEKDIDLAGRFCIVDDKQFLLSLTDTKVHSTQDMALWSKSEHAAGNILSPLFKLVWQHSKPIS
ncbi:MAG: helix-turn-helix domain-containing protein [Candidatus Aenigmatarchaeota archaeon]